MAALENKVVLITGGNSGIGRATALMAAREGAKVTIANRTPESGQQVVKEIKEAGGEAMFIQADVSKSAQVEAMVKAVVDTYGRLDGAFNNAGIAGVLAVTHQCKEEDWDECIDINLKSVWLCMKYEIEQMLKQGGGSIVNQGSAAGLVALPGALAYCAAKFGVVGLSKTAAAEYVKQNIRINAMCPSFVATPLTAQLAQDYPDLVQKAFPFQPIGRMGTPEEIASGVIWLLSDSASFASGMAMSVDGGYVAQ
jgi:NAD(P)-dependent dehydrogenase (short-subunit alcohol dehydrogenase family)